MNTQIKTQKSKDTTILLWGGILILGVLLYFVGRNLWKFQKQDEQSYDRLVTDTSSSVNAPTITATSLQKLIRTPGEKFLLVDVRPQTDYLISHIPTALSYPGTTVETLSLTNIEKVIIVGATLNTGEDENVMQILKNKNVPFAYLEGGEIAWEELNEQVVTTGDPTSIVDQSKVQYIKPEILKQRFQNGEKIFVLDVQTKAQYASKHLKDAINIPLAELESRIDEVPAGSKMVVYGNTDYEAFQAGITLFDLNIFSAEVIEGQNVLDTELFTEGSSTK